MVPTLRGTLLVRPQNALPPNPKAISRLFLTFTHQRHRIRPLAGHIGPLARRRQLPRRRRYLKKPLAQSRCVRLGLNKRGDVVYGPAGLCQSGGRAGEGSRCERGAWDDPVRQRLFLPLDTRVSDCQLVML